jgi:hypothetical protein
MEENGNNQEVLNLSADEKVQEVQEELQQINDNLCFNTRSLNTVTEHLVGNLNTSQVTIQKILDAMQTSLNQQELVVSKMNDESRVLCLIPQKMQDRIDMIAPKIATEVGVIHSAKIVEINNQFNLLQDKLTKDFDGYRQKLEITTKQCVEQLIDTSGNMKVTIEQKLTQFSNQLTEEVDAVLSQKSMRFLKNLAFIVLFSGLVSAFTSYLVATQFPRYVRVDAPNNLSIIDSKVQVWEAKSPNTKEHQINKQKESK